MTRESTVTVIFHLSILQPYIHIASTFLLWHSRSHSLPKVTPLPTTTLPRLGIRQPKFIRNPRSLSKPIREMIRHCPSKQKSTRSVQIHEHRRDMVPSRPINITIRALRNGSIIHSTFGIADRYNRGIIHDKVAQHALEGFSEFEIWHGPAYREIGR